MRKKRRDFLKSATVAGIAGVAAPFVSTDKVQAKTNKAEEKAAPPSVRQQSHESGDSDFYLGEESAKYFVDNPVSDFMVDTIRSLDIDYLSCNPGSSFRGIQESVVNYGGNKKPELLTCLHEESAVAMAHGYAKAAGKPMAMIGHGTVGLQHAAMAVYNAYCDRAPMLLFGGNYTNDKDRKPGVSWDHAAQNPVAPIEDYVKFHDSPLSPQHFAESVVRAHKIATTPPMGPVCIILDHDLQEESVGDRKLKVPKLSPNTPPQGDSGALREAAQWLVDAENPVILVDRFANTPAGMDMLVELAELLQAPVLDRLGRMNFPSRHHLAQFGNNQSLLKKADLILAMEVGDLYGHLYKITDTIDKSVKRLANKNAKVISIGVGDLYIQSNYQNFQRYQPVDMSINGDGEATVPELIEQIKSKLTRSRRSEIALREKGFRIERAKMDREAREQARVGWDASPVSVARLMMEVWHQIKDLDWSIVGPPLFQSYWGQRLWDFDKHHQYTGGSGGWGVGYFAPGAAGVALANKDKGRFTVCIQSDGDLMYAPGILWTVAHHQIPLLYVMHNNRSYHQEVMHLQRVALRRRRGTDGAMKIGNVLEDPNIDYARLADSMGVWSSGPITDPKDLREALERAVKVVKSGKPALVDVVCQPR